MTSWDSTATRESDLFTPVERQIQGAVRLLSMAS